MQCHSVQITIGENIRVTLDEALPYEDIVNAPLTIIIPSVVVPLLMIILCAGVCVAGAVLLFWKKYKTKEKDLTTEMSDLRSIVIGPDQKSKLS